MLRLFDLAYTLPPDANRVIISVNPNAGARPVADQTRRLAEGLSKRKLRCEIINDLKEATERANQLNEDGRLRSLVGAGGDGTAAELLNLTKPGVPITMLPAGTENLLSKYLGLTQPVEDLAETIQAGHVVLLDTGKANGRLFLLMIGCGLDADVVHRLHSQRKGHISHFTWIKPIAQTIFNYQYPKIRIYCGEQNRLGTETQNKSTTVRWLLGFNLPCYAGGLEFAPESSGTDGLLDICAFKGRSFFSTLLYAVGVLLGRHNKMSNCFTTRAKWIRITSKQKVPFQLDGDPGGFLPVEIAVVPKRLAVLVPPSKINN